MVFSPHHPKSSILLNTHSVNGVDLGCFAVSERYIIYTNRYIIYTNRYIFYTERYIIYTSRYIIYTQRYNFDTYRCHFCTSDFRLNHRTGFVLYNNEVRDATYGNKEQSILSSV